MDRHTYIAAKRCASHNRGQILQSAKCGCFYCLAIFPATYVEDWINDDDSQTGQTALCPYCGKDTIIGEAAGFKLDFNFLQSIYSGLKS